MGNGTDKTQDWKALLARKVPGWLFGFAFAVFAIVLLVQVIVYRDSFCIGEDWCIGGKGPIDYQSIKDAIANDTLLAESLRGKQGKQGPPGKPGEDGKDAAAGPSVDSLPVGAVVAFESMCQGPTWKLFDRAGGRFIVGAGHHANIGAKGKQLTIYEKQFLKGGEEEVTLEVEQMPPHNHVTTEAANSANIKYFGKTNVKKTASIPNKAGKSYRAMTGKAGGPNEENSSKADGHNNMPPFIALYFCEKVR